MTDAKRIKFPVSVHARIFALAVSAVTAVAAVSYLISKLGGAK